MKLLRYLIPLLLTLPAGATVVTQNITVTFACTGTTGPFPFNYSVSGPTALTVTQNGTKLTLTSQYTVVPVNNNYDNGGSVTLVSVCPGGQSLAITRTTPLTQATVFTDNMPTPMKAIENGLDKLTEITQELVSNRVTSIIPGANVSCTTDVNGKCQGDVTVNSSGGGTGSPGAPLYSGQFAGAGGFVGSLQSYDETLFPQGTLALRVNAAAAAGIANPPCHIVIPVSETATTSTWTTPLPNTCTLSDQRYTNGQGFAFGTTNIREGEQRTAYYGANLPFESGVNDGRFLLDLETDSYAGNSPANGGGLQIFTERTGGSRPIWSANFNTQVSNLSSTSVGLEMDTVNNSGADDTSDTMNALQIEASGANASGTAIFIGQGGGSWEDAVGIFSYHRTGIVLHPLSGRNSDFSIVPPADDSNLEMIGRNAANTTNVWTMDDSGNLNTTGHVQGNFIFGVNFGQIGPVYLGTGPTSSGLGLVWNTTGGQGESDFVNNHGSGGGGFNWYNSATSSPGSPIMQLDSTGKLNADRFNATTGFQIGGAAPNAHCLVGNGTNYVDNTCPGGGGAAWDDITNPAGNQALTMAAHTTAWTYNAATGSGDMVSITDTASNTGTGILVHPHTASSSTEIPFQADANGCGFKIDATGAWVSVGSGCTDPSQFDLTYNTGHAPVPPSATSASFAPDTSGHATFSEAGAAYSRVCTAANGVCASGGVTFPWSCQPGLGDGTNAITGATYPQSTCRNDTGQTVTITGIRCFSDNNGTSTMNVSGHTAGALLTGAVTCTNTYAAGTQSGTTTIAAGDWLVFSFIPDGTTKQTVADVVGTHP